MYYLYRHIRLDSNIPFYIGVGKYDVNYTRSKEKYSRSEEWKKVVDSFGYDIEIVCTADDLNSIYDKEKEFISLYSKYGLVNKTRGGGGILGHKVSDSHKEYLSIINTGVNHPQYGTKASDETRLKQSLAKRGSNSKTSTLCRCNETGEVFESYGEAARIIYGDRTKHKKVQDIIKGRRKTHLGFSFKTI